MLPRKWWWGLLMLVGCGGPEKGDCYVGLALVPGESCRHGDRSWDRGLWVWEQVYVFEVTTDGQGCLTVGEHLRDTICADSDTSGTPADWTLHRFAASWEEGYETEGLLGGMVTVPPTWTIERLP